jgi:hypothetical protein
MQAYIQSPLIALGAATFFSLSSAAYALYSQAEERLQVQEQGDVAYVTGGIGDEERAELGSMQRDFNLQVMNSGRDGAFTNDTQFAIHDRAGNEVLATQSGPLLYVQLPPGRYHITAENNGKRQQKDVRISQSKISQLHLVWP